MLQFLRSLFFDNPEAALPAVPSDERVYAIGDIHGRLDLLDALIDAIEQEDAEAPAAETTVILLGDLIDRGADSAGVIRRAREWQGQRKVRILCGNHEEMFLRSFKDAEIMRHFLRHGGRQTLLSYGVDRDALADASIEKAQKLMNRAVPGADRVYISGFEDIIEIGDYVFVHAGVDPEVPLEAQRKSDLRWIREPFLSYAEPLEKVVVHGHTISNLPEDRGNRIGIDTGAYSSGRLTALVLEGSCRRFIEAVEREEGTITAASTA